jgi:hypothetical protein
LDQLESVGKGVKVESLLNLSAVMPGLVPGIHVFPSIGEAKTWMAGT